MDQLAKYDPYTIKQIELYIQKKTKYTTLKSILVSLIILALTIIVSYEQLQDIWVSRSKLEIFSSDQKLAEETFTSQYLCVISRNISNKTPNTTLQNLNKNSNFSIKNFVSTPKFNQVQQVLSIANGRDFYCYDLAGSIVNRNYLLQLSVPLPGDVDIALKAYTLNEIIQEESSNVLKINPVYDGVKLLFYELKKLKSIVYDSLLVNYQPQINYGFKTELKHQQLTLVSTSPAYIFQFCSQDYLDTQLTQQINIKRHNIGQILGKFFSWFTIFILLFTYFIAPLVQFNFKVQLCRNIYDNKYLEKIQLSVLTHIKYLVSNFKKGIFGEQKLIQIFQKLEEDLNVLNLVKNQNIMKRLIEQNQQIQNKKPDECHQNKQLQQNQQQSQILFAQKQVQNSIQNQNTNLSKLERQQIEHKQIQIFDVSKDVESNYLKTFLNSLKSIDIGQTTISLITNKGQGYKNSYNTIITIAVFFLVLGFLIFAGAFTYTQNPQVKTILEGKDVSTTKSIVINPEDMIFRGIKSLTDKFVVQVKLVNANYQIIQNIVLKTGSDCDSYVQNLNQTIGTGWVCLPKPITLKNNGKNQKTKLFFRFAFPIGLPITSAKLQVTYKQTNLVNNQFVQNIVRVKQSFSNTWTKQFDVRLIVNKAAKDPEYVWTSYNYNLLDDAPMKGLSFQMTMDYYDFEVTEYTLWDIIDTSWGIFILTFTILLTKVTLYLNGRQRQKITSDNQNQTRNDISQILSIAYNIKANLFSKELQEINYFYKTKLQTQNRKVQ